MCENCKAWCKDVGDLELHESPYGGGGGGGDTGSREEDVSNIDIFFFFFGTYSYYGVTWTNLILRREKNFG